MNKDLEKHLEELGPEYRALVTRLLAVYRPRSREAVSCSGLQSAGRFAGWTAVYLVAASLLVFVVLGVVFRGDGPRRVYTVRASDPAFGCLQAAARNDGRMQEFLHTNVADRSCLSERRFGIITPLEYTLLTGSSAVERKTTEVK